MCSVDSGLWEYIQPYPASFATYGVGCPGGAGVPVLAAAQPELPWIGAPFVVRLSNIGTHPFLNIPFVFVGFSRTSWGATPLPFDLSSTGMPGCWLHAEPALAFTLPNSGGTADWMLALPNDPRIAGGSIYMQGGVTSLTRKRSDSC